MGHGCNTQILICSLPMTCQSNQFDLKLLLLLVISSHMCVLQ